MQAIAGQTATDAQCTSLVIQMPILVYFRRFVARRDARSPVIGIFN
ncbi:hypothetical protein [Phyllobacterium endophyticum]|nr:hypothetical protein [Phyllobacterium endophyticum]MBB3237144.1 hypothetical protein [Phyllobacterium endophyticum]